MEAVLDTPRFQCRISSGCAHYGSQNQMAHEQLASDLTLADIDSMLTSRMLLTLESKLDGFSKQLNGHLLQHEQAIQVMMQDFKCFIIRNNDDADCGQIQPNHSPYFTGSPSASASPQASGNDGTLEQSVPKNMKSSNGVQPPNAILPSNGCQLSEDPHVSQPKTSNESELEALSEPELKTLSEQEEYRKFDAQNYRSQLSKSLANLVPQDSGGQYFWFRRKVSNINSSACFERTCMFFIVCNAVMAGVHVEVAASEKKAMDDLVMFKYAQKAFTYWFTVELAVKLIVKGQRFFLSNPSWTWDFLDLFIVAVSLIEEVMQAADKGKSPKNVSFVRMVRMLRLISRASRVMRVLRLTKAFSPFRIMLTSLLCSLKSLVWVLVLMLFVMYLFAISFTSATTDFLVLQDRHRGFLTKQELDLFGQYGSLLRTTLTLYQSISGGFDWGVSTDLLGMIDSTWVLLFLFFHVFFAFAFLNVVTGVFCQSAMESAKQDYDNVVETHIESAETYARNLESLFRQIDSDCSGAITMREMEHHLLDPSIRAYLESLDINGEDAWTLFSLLDADGTNEVDIEEFVVGCLKLKGHARVANILKLSYESRSIHRHITQISKEIRRCRQAILGGSRETLYNATRELELPVTLQDPAGQLDALHDAAPEVDLPIIPRDQGFLEQWKTDQQTPVWNDPPQDQVAVLPHDHVRDGPIQL